MPGTPEVSAVDVFRASLEKLAHAKAAQLNASGVGVGNIAVDQAITAAQFEALVLLLVHLGLVTREQFQLGTAMIAEKHAAEATKAITAPQIAVVSSLKH